MFFEEKHFYTSLSYLNTITFNSWTWAQNNKNGKKLINYKKNIRKKKSNTSRKNNTKRLNKYEKISMQKKE